MKLVQWLLRSRVDVRSCRPTEGQTDKQTPIYTPPPPPPQHSFGEDKHDIIGIGIFPTALYSLLRQTCVCMKIYPDRETI